MADLFIPENPLPAFQENWNVYKSYTNSKVFGSPITVSLGNRSCVVIAAGTMINTKKSHCVTLQEPSDMPEVLEVRQGSNVLYTIHTEDLAFSNKETALVFNVVPLNVPGNVEVQITDLYSLQTYVFTTQVERLFRVGTNNLVPYLRWYLELMQFYIPNLREFNKQFYEDYLALSKDLIETYATVSIANAVGNDIVTRFEEVVRSVEGVRVDKDERMKLHYLMSLISPILIEALSFEGTEALEEAKVEFSIKGLEEGYKQAVDKASLGSNNETSNQNNKHNRPKRKRNKRGKKLKQI